jgi:hypothetical protein
MFMIFKASDVQSQGDDFSFFLSHDPFNSAGLYLPYALQSPPVDVVFDITVYNNSIGNSITILQTGEHAVAYNPVDFKLNDETLLKAWIGHDMNFDFQNSISNYVSSNLVKKPSQPVLTKDLDIHVEFQNQNLLFWLFCLFSYYKFGNPLYIYNNWFLEINVKKSN